MKNLAKRNFICFAILAVIMIALCFVNFTVPATTSKFTGFVPAITKDIDIAGGLASKYDITFDEGVLDEELELKQTVDMLSKKLVQFGYEGSSVSVGTNDNAYIEMPAIKMAEDVLRAVSLVGPLYITTDAQGSVNAETAISGKDVVDVTSQFSQTNASSFAWGVNIHLTGEGQEKLKELTGTATSGGSATLNIFVGDETVTSISISGQLDTADLYFFGTEQTEDQANITALQILMGKFGAEFDMVNNEVVTIAPLISGSVQTLIVVGISVVIAAIVAFFAVRFRECAYMVALNLAFFLTLTAFFMQAIPIFVLSYAGIVALCLGLGLFFVSNYMIFKGARDGYAQGKKIPLAMKMGLNNNVMKIVDMSVVAILLGVVVFFVGGVYAQSFALTLGIVAALNMLTSLALNKLFIKWYTRINTKQANKLGFTREENVNELD